MNNHVIASFLLSFAVVGYCGVVPDACQLPCHTNVDGSYAFYCPDDQEYCRVCREFFCQRVVTSRGIPAPAPWWNPFAGVGWNPFAAKTCDKFEYPIKADCTNDNQISSKCSLRCTKGYLPSPELYKGYGNKQWSYTHEQVMSFTATCSNSGTSADWTPNEFSCVEKKKVMEIFFPLETHLMLTKPKSPYPEDYILEVFNRDLKDEAENEEEASGGKRHLGWYAHCHYACMWENGKYKHDCRVVGIYACLACRLSNFCASSRSFSG